MNTGKRETSEQESRDGGKLSKTVSYYASYIILGLIVSIIGPTLPGLAEHTRTNLSEISFLFTTHSLGFLCGSLLAGRLYDRVRGHPPIAAAFLCMAVMLALVPLASLLWILAGILFILGIGEGLLDVGGNTLLVWVHGSRVGPYMNGLHFFFGLGALLSPIIVAQIVRLSGDINWAYWVLAIMIFPLIIVFLRLPSPPIHGSEGAHGDRDRNYMLVVLIGLFFFFHVGAEISYGGWIYTYALHRGIANETMAAYLNSSFWGALTLGRLIGIPVSTRLKPGAMLIIDLAGCLIACAVVLIWNDSAAATWVGTILMGMSLASLFPTSINLAERNMKITGAVTSWFFVGTSIGAMFFPWLIGQYMESVGPHVMFIVLLSIFCAASIILVIVLIFGKRRLTRREKTAA
ncbi:MAG: MFS transporter [Spirochaetes bacterium]|nr:MFS transporter [Spirochaetota bacterium]